MTLANANLVLFQVNILQNKFCQWAKCICPKDYIHHVAINHDNQPLPPIPKVQGLSC